MQNFIIFLIIFKLFFINKLIICFAANQYIPLRIYNTDYININNSFLYFIDKIYNINDHFTNPNHFYILDSCNYQHNTIDPSVFQHNSNLFSINYMQCHTKSYMKINNDTINVIYTFSEYLNNIMYDNLLLFVQAGIKNFLGEKNIIIGGGKRYLYKKNCIIGYNTTLCGPICNQKKQPYSVNIGGEYYYNNLSFKLNSYYNINNIMHSKTFLQPTNYQYPKIGYQICIESKLPYLLECKGQIKWEKLIYKKISFDEKQDRNNQALFVGIGYQPIPLLEIIINNLFIHKKYFNTIFSIILNYQFNVPLSQQINPRYYDNKHQLLTINHLNSIVEPFIPSVIYNPRILNTFNTNDNLTKPIITKITGSPGEIKFIKIDGDLSNITWNSKILENQGGKIMHVKNNIYAIHLPQYSDIQEIYVLLSYNIQNNEKEIIAKKQKIKIFIQNNIEKQQRSNMQTDTELIPCCSKNDENYCIEQKNYEKYNRHSTSNGSIDEITSNSVSSYCNINFFNTLDQSNKNNVTIDKNQEDKNNTISLPPPPPPLIPLINSSKNIENYSVMQQSSSSFTEGQPVSQSFSKNDLLYFSENKDYIQSDANFSSNASNSNLSYILSKHKKSKFSAVEKKEYIENLEKTIKERKKNKYSSEMEKMLIRLQITQSQSSIEESIKTDESIDNFSISSKKSSLSNK